MEHMLACECGLVSFFHVQVLALFEDLFKSFRYQKCRYSTKNAGTQPCKAFFLVGGWVFPYISRIHTAYIGEDEPSILGTNEMFGDLFLFAFFNTFSPVERWECLGKMTGAHEIPCRQNFKISSETTLGHRNPHKWHHMLVAVKNQTLSSGSFPGNKEIMGFALIWRRRFRIYSFLCIRTQFNEGPSLITFTFNLPECVGISTRWAPSPVVINGVTWDPYKWPKINGFHWGYFTLLIGAPCHSTYNWWRGTSNDPLNVSGVYSSITMTMIIFTLLNCLSSMVHAWKIIPGLGYVASIYNPHLEAFKVRPWMEGVPQPPGRGLTGMILQVEMRKPRICK